MAYSFQEEVSDGVRTLYPVNIDFINDGEVYVYSGEHETYNTQVSYRWSNSNTIELTDVAFELPAGTKFYIRRVTHRGNLLHMFSNAGIRGGALDQAHKQLLHISQELTDGFIAPPSEGDTVVNADMNMNQFSIFNMAMREVPEDSDVPTVEFVRRVAGGGAQTWAEQAEASAVRSEDAAVKSEGYLDEWQQSWLGTGNVFPTENLVVNAVYFFTGDPSYGLGLYAYIPGYYEEGSPPDWYQVSGVGPQGPAGPQGIQGPRGEKGDQGIEGPKGEQGQQGLQGAIGPAGQRGEKGETGATGPQGIQGVKGDTGNTGAQGPVGPDGPQGVAGREGPQGVKGDRGDEGTSFQPDAVGLLADRVNYDNEPKGFSYLATDYQVRVEEAPEYGRFIGNGTQTAFTLNWTPDGQQSIIAQVAGVVQGPDKYTVSIVNDVYTYTFNTAPANTAEILFREVTLSTGYGAIFMKNSNSAADWSAAVPFGRGPRGDQGAEGPTGPAGPQGPNGDQGSTGPQGPTGPRGPEGATGPQGATGDPGEKGAKGDPGDRGPIGIQGPEGQRGPQGIQGPQGNQGADGNQGIQGPQGAKGERGDPGITGPTGAQGPDGDAGRSVEATAQQYLTDAGHLVIQSGKIVNRHLLRVRIVNPEDYDRLLVIQPTQATIKWAGLAPSDFSDMGAGFFAQGDFSANPTIINAEGDRPNVIPVQGVIVTIPPNRTGSVDLYWRISANSKAAYGAGLGDAYLVPTMAQGTGSSKPRLLIQLFATGSSLIEVN